MIIQPPSPCVQICLLDPLDKICMGCGRHIDEIAQWPNFSDEQRQTILDRLRDRFADPAPAITSAAITSPVISADGPDQPAS